MAFRSIRDDQGNTIDLEWRLSSPIACQLVNKRVEDPIGQRLLDILPVNCTDGLFDQGASCTRAPTSRVGCN